MLFCNGRHLVPLLSPGHHRLLRCIRRLQCHNHRHDCIGLLLSLFPPLKPQLIVVFPLLSLPPLANAKAQSLLLGQQQSLLLIVATMAPLAKYCTGASYLCSQTIVDCYLSGAVITVSLSSASRQTTVHRPELAIVIVRHSHSSLLPAQAHRHHSQSPLFVDCCFWPACPCQRCRPCRHARALSSLPSWQLVSSFSPLSCAILFAIAPPSLPSLPSMSTMACALLFARCTHWMVRGGWVDERGNIFGPSSLRKIIIMIARTRRGKNKKEADSKTAILVLDKNIRVNPI